MSWCASDASVSGITAPLAMNSSITQTVTAATPYEPASASANANSTHSAPASRNSVRRWLVWSAIQAQEYGANTRVHDCSDAIEPIASALSPCSRNHSGAYSENAPIAAK